MDEDQDMEIPESAEKDAHTQVHQMKFVVAVGTDVRT